jgi:hypothetical protein
VLLLKMDSEGTSYFCWPSTLSNSLSKEDMRIICSWSCRSMANSSSNFALELIQIWSCVIMLILLYIIILKITNTTINNSSCYLNKSSCYFKKSGYFISNLLSTYFRIFILLFCPWDKSHKIYYFSKQR